MSRELRICPGVGARKCGAFLARLDRDPHPTCTRCRGKICTRDMTCDFCAVWSAEQWELFAKKRSYKERKHRPSGSAPSAQQTSPRAETSSGVSRPGTSSSSSSHPLGGQERGEGSQGAPGVVSGGAPSPPARPRSSERGGSASRHLSGVSGLAPSFPSGGGGAGVARSRQTSFSRVSESVDSPSFSPHVPRRENVRESSDSCSRDSRSSGREPRKDKRARSRESSSRGRRRRSRSSYRSLSRGRERARRSSSASRSSRDHPRRERSRSSDRYRSRRGSSRSRRDRSRSSDRYRSHRDRSRRERSRSFDRSRSRREHARSPARRGERRDRTLP